MPVNQLAIYVLVLVLGWLLGLLSRSGGARWRRQYEAEHAERIAADATYREREASMQARIVELEHQVTAAAHASTLDGSRTIPTDRNDLSLIRGVDRTIEASLNEAGIFRYIDIDRMTEADAAILETRIGVPSGTILREEWREQAARLDRDLQDRHVARP